jgi:phosphoribosylformimino-5-aminoimidazole carboxamide ribotide isomerase
VSFLILPALDVSGGRLARLTPSGPEALAAFGGDPGAAAEALLAAGARWFHVVDLDLAFRGEPSNLGVIRALTSLGGHVQAAGGLRSAGEVEAVLGAGAERAVLGSAALHDRRAVEKLVTELGERLVVGIEAGAGRIEPRGRPAPPLELGATLAWLRDLAPARALRTALGRVGSLSGPDVEGLREVVDVVGCPVLAAGGIGSADDLRAVADAGAEGAVVGRGLLEGRIDHGVLRAAG